MSSHTSQPSVQFVTTTAQPQYMTTANAQIAYTTTTPTTTTTMQPQVQYITTTQQPVAHPPPYSSM
jgi:hypothetical protein